MPMMTYQQLVVFWPFSMILCEAVEESEVVARGSNFKSLNLKQFLYLYKMFLQEMLSIVHQNPHSKS